MTERKYLLCVPCCGLNDTLNQIEICRAYAARYGRILLVDGRNSGVMGEFGDYFQMEGDGHIFNMTDPAVPKLDTLSCLPAEVQGRISSIRVKVIRDTLPVYRVDHDSGARLGFPTDRDHPEALLLHQQGGGGSKSFDLLDRLTLVPSLAQQARDRIDRLPARYSALHIRNTDYRTDVQMTIDAIRSHVAGQDLLVCSDDQGVFQVIRTALPTTRIHQITTPHFGDNQPQHLLGQTAEASVRHLIASSSLFDLCALAAADTLYLPVLDSLERGGQVRASYTGKNKLGGFSRIAAYLCEDKDRLRRLLGRAGAGLKPDIRLGRVRTIKTT